MSDPLSFRGKIMLGLKNQTKHLAKIIRNNHILFVALVLTIIGSSIRVWNTQPVFYAHAYSEGSQKAGLKSPLFGKETPIFAGKKFASNESADNLNKIFGSEVDINADFENKINEIVGNAPIREMAPFIAKRDQHVAAFLVGIAKKESSFGLASPSKDGETCYNYWGYKGSAGRGTGMGYACFASAEEAVKTVGDRIEVLVNKNRNTPQRMVDTWKCGVSCKGDAGAPGWVSTVALYYNKIVDQNS